MSRKLGLFVFILVLVCAFASNASMQWTDKAVPTQIYLIQGCGNNSTTSIAIVTIPGYSQMAFDMSSPGAQAMYTTIQESITFGKKVQILFANHIYLNFWAMKWEGNCYENPNTYFKVWAVAYNSY